jgi:hypothetical protein
LTHLWYELGKVRGELKWIKIILVILIGAVIGGMFV